MSDLFAELVLELHHATRVAADECPAGYAARQYGARRDRGVVTDRYPPSDGRTWADPHSGSERRNLVTVTGHAFTDRDIVIDHAIVSHCRRTDEYAEVVHEYQSWTNLRCCRVANQIS